MAISDWLDNSIAIDDAASYATILGATPSKGARSPHLWNAAFRGHSVDAVMVPMDVSKSNLVPLLNELDLDPAFLGGAVTIPYKEVVADWLGERLTAEAKIIGTINCLYRREGGELCGTNTDGEAALLCAKRAFGDLSGKRVLQLGAGGAGKAVAAFLAGDGAELTICVREFRKIKHFADSIGASLAGWSSLQREINDCDLLVNTTSVGFTGTGQAEESPVPEFMLDTATPMVFDIIYDPSPSMLIRFASSRNLRTMDGRCMNLEQAVLAFGHAQPDAGMAEETRSLMSAECDRLDRR